MERALAEIRLSGVLAQKILHFYRQRFLFSPPPGKAEPLHTSMLPREPGTTGEPTATATALGWAVSQRPAGWWQNQQRQQRKTTADATRRKAGFSPPQAAYLCFQFKWPESHFPAGYTYSSLQQLGVAAETGFQRTPSQRRH